MGKLIQTEEYFAEFSDRTISITLADGLVYEGRLTGYEMTTLSFADHEYGDVVIPIIEIKNTEDVK